MKFPLSTSFYSIPTNYSMVLRNSPSQHSLPVEHPSRKSHHTRQKGTRACKEPSHFEYASSNLPPLPQNTQLNLLKHGSRNRPKRMPIRRIVNRLPCENKHVLSQGALELPRGQCPLLAPPIPPQPHSHSRSRESSNCQSIDRVIRKVS